MFSEQTLYDALKLYDVLTDVNPNATHQESAEDAASFAILDAITDERKGAEIRTTAELVIKLANQMKGK